MSGAEHYRAAERWLNESHRHADSSERDDVLCSQFAAQAQVHATLALAAAAVWGTRTLPTSSEGGYQGYGEEW